jgi:ATP-dependent RNA helicase DeaD
MNSIDDDDRRDDAPPDDAERRTVFRDLDLPEAVLASLDGLNFVHPTPIQEGAIPIVLEGRDLIGKAETGTGKTLAFTAPVIGQLDPERVTVQALVLCPTRELAQQCAEVATDLGEPLGIKTALLVGGVHQAGQILQLRRGAHFAVGTPGRGLGYAHHVILDEADRMLDMGFIDDVSSILERTPRDRQTLLFSATIPPRIRSLMKRFMRDPETVSTTKEISTVPNIRQKFARVGKHDKERFVLELLDRTPGETSIVFCNTRRAVIELDRSLWGRGYPAGSLHGDHDQERRFKVLEGFKKKQITALVATDVAARGLDIEAVHRVINFDVPDEVETYVHRIGRTGRAGGTGESITLVSPLEKRYWDRIVESSNFDVEEIPFRGTRPPPPDPFESSRGGRGRSGPGGRRSGGPSRSGPSRGGSGGGPRRSGGGGSRRRDDRRDESRSDRRDDRRDERRSDRRDERRSDRRDDRRTDRRDERRSDRRDDRPRSSRDSHAHRNDGGRASGDGPGRSRRRRSRSNRSGGGDSR